MMRMVVGAAVVASMLAGPAMAQNRGFNDNSGQSQGFSFQNDEVSPSYDRKYLGRNNGDPRYAQTNQEQEQAAKASPGGGCLRYGAVGAAGGHLAGHGVLGALAGCAVGHYVRKRDQRAIDAQQGR